MDIQCLLKASNFVWGKVQLLWKSETLSNFQSSRLGTTHISPSVLTIFVNIYGNEIQLSIMPSHDLKIVWFSMTFSAYKTAKDHKELDVPQECLVLPMLTSAHDSWPVITVFRKSWSMFLSCETSRVAFPHL